MHTPTRMAHALITGACTRELDCPTHVDHVNPLRAGRRAADHAERLESGIWHPEPQGDARETYSIAIPPPNITGVLHMGSPASTARSRTRCAPPPHARQADKVDLRHRPREASRRSARSSSRALERLGTSRVELGREGFLERTWSWRERYGATIVEQYKRLGASCDFTDERFTLDERYVDAVLTVFVALYERGLIHRDNYMVNWDPGSGSAISDLEVQEREETDTLYRIAYLLADGSGEIVVATVRPRRCSPTRRSRTPATSATASWSGAKRSCRRRARLLPIIADEHVKPDFGTGALKITPADDPNDFEIGRRHGLAGALRDRRGRADDRRGRRALRRAQRDRRARSGGR